ncbi:MAG: mandelate racemase/muconate lactonizing enzyme family protein [Candidatus Latescibacteria bacterium]|nr:mandelate racemase/muconate lactonizing enzyme family protein [Candidatus Latescibacterota bacterium]
MKVTTVELFHVDVPMIPAIAKYRTKIYDITLCRITTDEGLCGVGESAVYHLDAASRERLDGIGQSYVGKNPLLIDAFEQPSLFECALFDIAGQAYGIPVWQFFGQKVRDRIPVSYWSCAMEPQDSAAEAEVGASLGFTNHKLKARSWNIVETVRLMKEAAGPEYMVGVDPNLEFGQLHVASRLAGELEAFGTVSNLEDPIPHNQLSHYRMLREKTHLPLAIHFGAPQAGGARPCRSGDVLSAVKAECIDYATLGGSVLEVRKAAAVAEAADMPCWVQMGGVCLGVLAAYSVHLQATLKNATLPCDELPFVRDVDLLGGSMTLDQGHFVLPEGPGLGVELDMDLVQRYRVG